ncbi:MAG: DUF3025 domain-containing protein [Burkholderiaceae bacterium]
MACSEHFLTQIDWQQPWLISLRSVADVIASAPDWRAALNAAAAEKALCNHRGLPLRFVPQEELPAGMAYEAFISQTGCVPTRENLHDFFNALVWLNYPHIKVQLNALQAAEIESASGFIGKAARRGKVRDAATIFDENAALLVTCDASLIDSLRAHHWQEVFVTRRAEFQQRCEVRLFGHALMEKLVRPYKAITAHAWVVMADHSFFALDAVQKQRWIDSVVADQLKADLQTSGFTPLPVLGVPGWSQGQDEAYYSDTAVFRPKRSHTARNALQRSLEE